MEKPGPLTAAVLMVTEPAPVEVRVRVCVVAVFTETLPKLRVDELTESVDAAGLSCRENVWEVPPALAVNVAVCAVLTAETVAEKLAEVAPAAMVTEAGTETEVLLLARPITEPPVAAAAFTVTVQASVPAPVMEAFVQDSPVSAGTPVPLKAMAVEVPAEELLDKVNCPVAAPAEVGSNWTVSVAD
jgi:hypothetical protein